MAKGSKITGKGEAPPVVSTLPPPEPEKPRRKRALPDDIPRGSLPPPKRKAKSPAPEKVKRPSKALLAKQAELEAQKLGTPAADQHDEWDADAAFAEARASYLAKEAAKRKAPIAPEGAILVPGARRARKPKAGAEHVERKLELMPHGGALKRSTLEKPDPRDTAPTKTGAPVEAVEPEPRAPMSDILFRSICLEISEGIPLRQICRRSGSPSKTAFYEYLDGADLGGEDPAAPDVRSGRLARYARARKLGYDALAEESLEIADDGTNDWVEREKEDGRLDVEVDRDHIQRSKLRIETRLKLLAVWDPKRYGAMIKVGDPDAKPLDNGGKSASDIAIGMAKLLAAAQREAKQQGEEA